MKRIEIRDRSLFIYNDKGFLMQQIVLKEIKGFRVEDRTEEFADIKLFTKWDDTLIRLPNEEAQLLIDRLSGVLEDNKVEIPELTGNTVIVRVNRYLEKEEYETMKSNLEIALGKEVVLLDKSYEIIGSVDKDVSEEEEVQAEKDRLD